MLLNPYRFSPTSGGDPYWANVVALLHFDGANGSAVFADSKREVSWAAYDGAILNSSTKRFGSASGAFNAAAYLSLPTSADMNMGTGDWTVEGWANITALTNLYGTLFANAGSWSGGARYIMASQVLGGKITVGGFDAVSGGGSYQAAGNNLITSTSAMPIGAWFHFAVTRSGNTLRLFLNGVLEGAATTTAPWDFSRTTTHIGANGWDIYDSRFNGFIDEFRVTKGIARYTANFTPPSAPFPDS